MPFQCHIREFSTQKASYEVCAQVICQKLVAPDHHLLLFRGCWSTRRPADIFVVVPLTTYDSSRNKYFSTQVRYLLVFEHTTARRYQLPRIAAFNSFNCFHLAVTGQPGSAASCEWKWKFATSETKPRCRRCDALRNVKQFV